ncbi:MAG TPA: cyanophycinase [Candidatus Atribacteria bacterium]|nr:cyanophycinase [Candidatus Atribacteria bacterium]HPT79447.1 cyanophycinase [Candidatus Atribacteria bacterium]
MDAEHKGKLVIIGGAEDKKGDCVILRKVAELAGESEGKIVIMTVATEYPSKVGAEYKKLFEKLHIGNIDALHIETRADANDSDSLKRLDNATCVFFTGGDQLKITSLLGGSKAGQLLNEMFENGLVIAGTSAGASVMSETMITSGNDDDAPKKCTVKMAPGLGMLKGAVIDQHFAQRGRVGRLLAAVAQNPNVLGIGIDEDTAIIVDDDTFEVIGSNAVTILDGVNLSYTNVSESRPDDILALTNIALHILPDGYRFDMKKRIPLLGR